MIIRLDKSVNKLHVFAAVLLCVSSAAALAQSPDVDEQPLPDPETLKLPTDDGVQLETTYYPGTEGKKTAVVILLHGETGDLGTGSGRDCGVLARSLQKDRHAVFVPDLRGFGRSVVQNAGGTVGRLDASRFRSEDIEAMVRFDMEALKKKIVELHNQGELNANLICLVGFDLGSVVALNWARLDWNMPSLPTLKQGQDVRAMVLVSPLQSFRGYPIRDALADEAVRSDISVLVAFGKRDPAMAASGRRIYRTFERSHQPLPSDEQERLEKQDLFLHEFDTSLQGTRLLSVGVFQLNDLIREFVQRRVVQQRDRHPWQSRAIR